MVVVKAKDSIKLWFETLKEDGEYVDLTVLRVTGDKVEEFNFPHGEVDGIGAFLKLHKKKSTLKVMTKMRKKVPWYRYAWGFIMYTSRLPFRSANWKSFNKDWREEFFGKKPSARSFTFFDREQTKLIKTNARKVGANLNSFLLYYLNQSLLELQKPGKTVWLIPVSMRGSINEEATKNEVGFTDAYCTKDINPAQIDRQIKKRLRRGEHLGGVIGVSLGVFLGKNLLKKLVHLNKYLQVRTGVFTNLGEGQDSQSDFMYSGFPPVIETQPVGALAGIWNGCLTLSLHFHPALGLTAEDAQFYLDNWRRSVLGGDNAS